MKQFCLKIDLISHRRENVLFLPSNMATMTSHENALYQYPESSIFLIKKWVSFIRRCFVLHLLTGHKSCLSIFTFQWCVWSLFNQAWTSFPQLFRTPKNTIQYAVDPLQCCYCSSWRGGWLQYCILCLWSCFCRLFYFEPPYVFPFFYRHITTCILDGEMVIFDSKTETWLYVYILLLVRVLEKLLPRRLFFCSHTCDL